MFLVLKIYLYFIVIIIKISLLLLLSLLSFLLLLSLLFGCYIIIVIIIINIIITIIIILAIITLVWRFCIRRHKQSSDYYVILKHVHFSAVHFPDFSFFNCSHLRSSLTGVPSLLSLPQGLL